MMAAAFGGRLGSSAGEEGGQSPIFVLFRLQGSCQGNLVEGALTQPVGKALTPSEDQGELSTEDVPEAVGGTAEDRPQPPLSRSRRMCHLLFQSPGLAWHSGGEMGKEGQVEERICSNDRAG